ncbi:RIKEN cDNA 2810437L13, isoform CRA_b, partial [Mus musculus]
PARCSAICPASPSLSALDFAVMSTAMNFGTKSFQPRPPDKGSFPLDHFGECKSFKEKFMRCLRDKNYENALCRNESKEYLMCRMQSGSKSQPR